ncbi:hypothetical protein Tco_1532885 [Tanacetum coccineum]
MLRKGSDFSEESIEKSWGKESANESGLKFIPCFDSSFFEFIQQCFCFTRMVIVEPGVGATTRSAAYIGGSFLFSNGTLLFRRRSPRFRVRLGSGNGSTSSELEARGESSAKRHKTSDQGTYSLGESSTKQVMEESNPSDSGEVDEAQLQKAMNDMLRVPYSKKASSSVPPMTLLNQEILYLNYGSSGPNKYVPSLHKYPVVLFPENDLEELISRWENERHNPVEVYLELKIVELVKTLYELGHE